MKRWNDIRSNWVNGNRSDVREAINNLTKYELLKVVQQALVSFVNTSTPNCFSGDLIDLLEICKSVTSKFD